MATQSWKDLRKTAEDASKPLPEGWYDVQVEKAEATTSSTNKPMIKLVLQVTSGPQAGNRKVWTQIVFSPDSPFALQMFFQNLAAFGFNEAFFDSLPAEPEAGISVIAQQLVGAVASVKIAPRAYQGVERDNVMEYQPKAGAGTRQASVAPAPGGVGGAAPAAPIPAGASPVQAPAPQVPPAAPAGGPSAPPTPVF